MRSALRSGATRHWRCHRFGRLPSAVVAGVAACVLLLWAGRADAGWVVGGYFGAAATARTYLAVTQVDTATNVRFDSVGVEGRSFSFPVYYGYRAAYFFGPDGWFGLEGEVIHMKVFAEVHALAPASGTLRGVPVAGDVPIDGLVQRFSLSHGQNLLLFNAVVRHVFGDCGDPRTARFAVLVRAGAGPTLPHVESTIGGIGDERYEWGAIVLQLAAGIDVRVWNRLHALVEYKFTRCRQSVATADASTVETLLTSHHVVFGAAVHF